MEIITSIIHIMCTKVLRVRAGAARSEDELLFFHALLAAVRWAARRCAGAFFLQGEDVDYLSRSSLHASRHSATFRAFRKKLQDTGKPVKVALTATAKKLLSVLNSMVADGTCFREVQPS
ncbi:hypothetical protein [Salipiger marinus]|uniref:hypothetical protein n=1 Tax=Salipiger marinus TaxID=555512 RepID=UPI0013F4E98C|nr:hypothetical protein [Salipiger marinus]